MQVLHNNSALFWALEKARVSWHWCLGINDMLANIQIIPASGIRDSHTIVAPLFNILSHLAPEFLI